MPRIEFVVITCGEPTTHLCLASISSEIAPSDIRMVQDIYPMSAAFNRMFDSQADWVVQVDADFIFYRGFASRFEVAVADALEEERNAGVKIHAVTFSLYDPFEQRTIGWCKAFQMRHVRSEGIAFQNVRGCDMVMMQEFAGRGYLARRLPFNRPIGDHYLTTCAEVFSRWSEMVAKFGPQRVDRPLLDLWIDRVKTHGSALHAAALLGVFQPRGEQTERNRQEEMADPVRRTIADAGPEELVSRALDLLKNKGLA